MRQVRRMFSLLVGVPFCLLVVLAGLASAQDGEQASITVFPAVQPSGQEKPVKFTNEGGQPVTLELAAHKLGQAENGALTYREADDEVSFAGPRRVTLAAGESVDVKLSAEQYGAVVATILDDSKTNLKRIAAIMAADGRAKHVVLGARPQMDRNSLSVHVRNDGNSHKRVSGIVLIGGKSFPIREAFVLPEATVGLQAEGFDWSVQAGERIEGTVELSDGTTGDIAFTVPADAQELQRRGDVFTPARAPNASWGTLAITGVLSALLTGFVLWVAARWRARTT